MDAGEPRFTCLFATNKTKKKPTWLDGICTLGRNNKISIFDESGAQICSEFSKTIIHKILNEGLTSFELERCLVELQDRIEGSKEQSAQGIEQQIKDNLQKHQIKSSSSSSIFSSSNGGFLPTFLTIALQDLPANRSSSQPSASKKPTVFNLQQNRSGVGLTRPVDPSTPLQGKASHFSTSDQHLLGGTSLHNLVESSLLSQYPPSTPPALLASPSLGPTTRSSSFFETQTPSFLQQRDSTVFPLPADLSGSGNCPDFPTFLRTAYCIGPVAIRPSSPTLPSPVPMVSLPPLAAAPDLLSSAHPSSMTFGALPPPSDPLSLHLCLSTTTRSPPAALPNQVAISAAFGAALPGLTPAADRWAGEMKGELKKGPEKDKDGLMARRVALLQDTLRPRGDTALIHALADVL